MWQEIFSTWTGQRFKTPSCAVSVTLTRPSCTSINHMTIFSCTSAGRVKCKKVYDGNQTYVLLLNCCCASDHLVAHMNLVGNFVYVDLLVGICEKWVYRNSTQMMRLLVQLFTHVNELQLTAEALRQECLSSILFTINISGIQQLIHTFKKLISVTIKNSKSQTKRIDKNTSPHYCIIL